MDCGLLSRRFRVQVTTGVLLKALIHNRFVGYFNHSPTIHNIVKWTPRDSMGQIYGSERALLFGKPVPFCCQMQGRGWQKWDFFYYVFIIEFLSVSYRFLIKFNKNSHVNLLIFLILGVEVLCSSGKFGCGALLI